MTETDDLAIHLSEKEFGMFLDKDADELVITPLSGSAIRLTKDRAKVLAELIERQIQSW